MRTKEELIAMCEGYLEGLLACNADLYDWDDWVLWGGYDINFTGQHYTSTDLGKKDLLVVVYPAGWEGDLPDHLHSFVVTSTKGESK